MADRDRSSAQGGSGLQGKLEEADVRALSTVLKALAHPVRLRMIDLIQREGGDICVCEFEKHFELKQPTISHHLRVLRDAALIRSRQDGTSVRSAVDARTFERTQRLIARLAADAEPCDK